MEDKSKSLKRRREDDSIPSSPEACNDPHESALAVVVAQVDENVWSNIASYFWLDDLLKLRTVCQTLRRAVHLTLSQATALHLSLFQIHKKCRGMIPNNGNPHHSFDAGVAQLVERTKTRCLLHFDVSGIRHLTGRLPGMYDNYHHNPTTWLVDLFQQAPCLESIILTWCARFEGACFQEALQGPQIPNLRHLGLIGCTRIENRTLHAILRSPWFQSLRSLHIGGCSQTIGMEPVVTELLFRMPNLQSLDISGLDRIQGPDLWALLANLTQLEILGASECRGIQLPPNPVLEELINQQLQHPNLVNGGDILDQMDRATRVYQDTNQRHDFRLQVLRLDEIGSSRNNSHPGSLAYVAMTSRRLVEVSLSGCHGLVDYDVLLLVMFCHETLRSICLRDIPKISDRALEAMGARCSQLIELDVSACARLTDRGIVALVSGCPPLRVLRMAHLPELTDKSLRSIATHLNRLIVLDIHECFFPNPPSTTIAFSSHHLVELDARDCNLGSTPFDRIPSLSIRDGRRIPRRGRRNTTTCTECQVWNHAQRLKPQQGVPLRPMWHCRDCSLVPSRDRAMCDYCASHCHKGHAVFCSGFTRFYCDCAFGYGGSDCQSFIMTD